VDSRPAIVALAGDALENRRAAAVSAAFADQPRREIAVPSRLRQLLDNDLGSGCPFTAAGKAAPHPAVGRCIMSITAIASSSQVASLYLALPGAVISQIATTNFDGSVTTITTTYANGTTSTVTEPSPPSSLVTRQASATNADGSIAVTSFYADGRTTTATQANPNPTNAPSVLDPNNPTQRLLLLWV
jgi:hypothetical protein